MSVQKILQESIEKNPLSLKEAFVEELRARLGLAIEAKMYGEEVGQVDEGHGVFRKGGSIGEANPSKPIKVHDNIEDAKTHANRLNAQLSTGEKKHYGIKYHVKSVNEGFAVVEEVEESFDLSDFTIEEIEDFTVSEEFDLLDEISKKTVVSYLSKALKSKDDAQGDRSFKDAAPGFKQKDPKTYSKRSAGIARGGQKVVGMARVNATESFDLSDFTIEEIEDFMMSEEFEQLDEISVEKLDNYYKAVVAQGQRLPLKRDEKEVAKRRLRTKYATRAFYKSDRLKRDALKANSVNEAEHDDAVKAFLAKGGKVTKVPEGERDAKLSATFRRIRGSDANKAKLADPNAKKPEKNNDLMSAELARQKNLKMREKEKASGKFDLDESEQIDEISTPKLARYMKSAATDMANKSADREYMKSNMPDKTDDDERTKEKVDKSYKKMIDKRKSGIATATSKISSKHRED